MQPFLRLLVVCAVWGAWGTAGVAGESCVSLRELVEREDKALEVTRPNDRVRPEHLSEIVYAKYGSYTSGWRDVTANVRRYGIVISAATVGTINPQWVLHVRYTTLDSGRSGWNTVANTPEEALMFFERYGLSEGTVYGCATADPVAKEGDLHLAYGCGCGSIGKCTSKTFIYHDRANGRGHEVQVGTCGCCATWFIVMLVLILLLFVGGCVGLGIRRKMRKQRKMDKEKERIAKDPEKYYQQKREQRRRAREEADADLADEFDDVLAPQYGDHADDWIPDKAPKNETERREQEVARHMRAREHRLARLNKALANADQMMKEPSDGVRVKAYRNQIDHITTELKREQAEARVRAQEDKHHYSDDEGGDDNMSNASPRGRPPKFLFDDNEACESPRAGGYKGTRPPPLSKIPSTEVKPPRPVASSSTAIPPALQEKQRSKAAPTGGGDDAAPSTRTGTAAKKPAFDSARPHPTALLSDNTPVSPLTPPDNDGGEDDPREVVATDEADDGMHSPMSAY